MTGAPRIDKEQARNLVGKPDVVLLDVRSEQDWQGSDLKISGALREDREKVESWATKYDPFETLILYCA